MMKNMTRGKMGNMKQMAKGLNMPMMGRREVVGV